MSSGWVRPAWGEPSRATEKPVPLRVSAHVSDASYRAEGGLSAEFSVMGASVAGISHRLSGRRCEDAFAWALPSPGRLALAVADGVSTAGRGGEGADLAVRAVTEFVGRGPSGWGERECAAAMDFASDALERAGGDAALELSTTLIVALLTSTVTGGAVASLARTGDSAAFSLSAAGAWREIFDGHGTQAEVGSDDGRDLLSTATDVLPWPRGRDDRRAMLGTASLELVEGSALVLVTDGVANPLRDGPSTVAPGLAAVLRAMADGELSPLELAQAADFSRRGAHDDRTILVAWPQAPGG